MGCDIHITVEKLVEGSWVNMDKWGNTKWDTYDIVQEIWEGRNYKLFSILANVRNGYGFAGIKTGKGFIPISEPKGIPEDCSDITKEFILNAGDHSHSYLTLKELLDFDWTQTTICSGTVNGIQFAEFLFGYNKGKQPESYCGSVGGHDIHHYDNLRLKEEILKLVPDIETSYNWQTAKLLESLENSYTQVSWKVNYHDVDPFFWHSTIPKLLKMSEGNYNNVRIVFCFDN